MKPPILIWTATVRAARRNYRCKNCQDLIPKGSPYERRIVRIGSWKFHDPLQHWCFHLDCEAPWWHADAPRRLMNLGQVPRRLPPKDNIEDRLAGTTLGFEVTHPGFGTIVGRLTESFTSKLLYSKRPQFPASVAVDIEQSLALFMHALVSVAGKPKEALKLSHALNDIAALVPPPNTVVPPTKAG